MRLIWAHITVAKPLFDGSVLVPGVVARQGLLRWCQRVLEDVVLAVKDGSCLD